MLIIICEFELTYLDYSQVLYFDYILVVSQFFFPKQKMATGVLSAKKRTWPHHDYGVRTKRKKKGVVTLPHKQTLC